MHSAIYHGWVRHRRFQPTRHAFRYRLFMLYLDLAELEQLFEGRWLWSTRRFAFARFRREQHFGDPTVPLDEAVRDLVQRRTGRRPAGPIRLLCHPAYLGYCFNPIAVFYCFDETGEWVEAIVAEVTNTPWGERHCYVLDARDGEGSPKLARRFAKRMHVSPFMGMNQSYDWRSNRPGERLVVHIAGRQQAQRLLDATLVLERRPMTPQNLALALTRHPLMTWKVAAGIHWEALRLWLKRVPIHDHPKYDPDDEKSAHEGIHRSL